VEACRPFLENLCTQAHIHIDFRLTDEAIPVHLDTVLFQQVLINIVKNAVESIGNENGLIILAVTTPATLTITDNGHGIPSAIAKHLFTPFFSTKPQGQGLGLLLIRDILTSHHCTFSLLTDPEDHLTRFTIQFPART
jgi:signal transduction histidine kinase